jgi:hypothetical protein
MYKKKKTKMKKKKKSRKTERQRMLVHVLRKIDSSKELTCLGVKLQSSEEWCR